MDHYILKSFFDYYAFICKKKDELVQEEKEQIEDSPDILESGLVRIQNEFAGKIDELCLSIKERNAYLSTKMLENIKVNLCAFTDELIIDHLDENSHLWQNYLIEVKVFSTTIGGERFFEVIDLLLSNYEKSYKDIAFLYTAMLRLGFKGRYRDQEDQTPLKSYLNSLLEFSMSEKELEPQKYLLPENYQSIFHGKPKLLFPSYRQFLINICLFVFCYFVVYGIIWFLTIGEVSSLIEAIKLDNLLNF